MSADEPHEPGFLFQETRLDLSPASPSSTLDVLVSSQSSYGFSSRSNPKRRRIDHSDAIHDEQYFSKNYLASESCIYFRRHLKDAAKQQYPRSILWRVLENRRVLELQCVDLFQESQQEEPLLTLRFEFANAIKPSAVAFAEYDEDAGKRDAVIAFVVTEKGELFTLTLRKVAFEQTTYLTESNDWFRSFTPGALSSYSLYRLYARSPDEVWMTLNNGSLARLQKQPADHGSHWRESFYTEGGWTASMRGLIPWKGHSTVRYNDMDLSASAATSLAFSPNESHIWTVCLDHTLRAWNVETGKITIKIDLAGDASRDLSRPSSVLLEPSHSQLISVQGPTNRDEYNLATFSPKENAFNFWTINDGDSSDGIDATHPDVNFLAPLGTSEDSSVWTLESFYTKCLHRTARDQSWTIWLFARSGPRYRVYNLKINLALASKTVHQHWELDWTKVEPGLNSPEAWEREIEFPTSTDNKSPNSLPSEEWARFIFRPGRVAPSTLETALVVYRKGLDSHRRPASAGSMFEKRPIDERIVEAVETAASSKRSDLDKPWYELREENLSSQWEVFYSLVKDLHKRCQLPISLVFDTDCEEPWLIMANQVGPIRKCAEVETLQYNHNLFGQPKKFQAKSPLLLALKDVQNTQIGQLLNVISIMASVTPVSVLNHLHNALRVDCFESSEVSSETRMQFIHEKVDYASSISDEDWQYVADAVELMGGFDSLSGQLFDDLVGFLDEPADGATPKIKKQMTRYGSRFLIRGAQETIQLSIRILVQALLFVNFIGCELEDLPDHLSPSNIFDVLSAKLKEYEVRSWLANTVPATVNVPEKSDSSKHRVFSGEMTILESLFIGDWPTMKFPNINMIRWLTYSCRAWTLGTDLNVQYNSITLYIMGALLRERVIDEASSFSYFLPSTPWALYLRARLALATGDADNAAVLFNNAATELTEDHLNVEDLDGANLLDLEEKTKIGEGAAPYYQHVASLFERAQAKSYVAEYLQHALDSYRPKDPSTDKFYSELLVRLFSALSQSLRFKEAFEVLRHYSNHALRKADLHTLVQTLLAAGQAPLLLSISFEKNPDIAEEIDDYLGSMISSSKSQTTLLSSTSVSSSSLTSAARSSTSPHKILYAWRISRGDFRGAAACLWDRLQVLEAEGSTSAHVDDEKAELYLGALNALSLMGEDDAWILSRPVAKRQGLGLSESTNGSTGTVKPTKRRIVTLAEIRAAWQDELDRQADIEAGRFPLSDSMIVEAPRVVGFG